MVLGRERKVAEFHRLTQEVLREVELARLALPGSKFYGARTVAERGVPPVERLVDYVLAQAMDEGASDIHVEPQAEAVRIRSRVDGILGLRHELFSKKVYAVFLSRIKVLAKMNVSERLRPQDGQFSFRHRGARVDVRVATMPTVTGESLVLRLLGHGGAALGLEELGFRERDAERFRALIKAPAGLLILAGPMGAGKTTTLYAALSALLGADETAGSIVTLDDPVEYVLPGALQVPIREETGLTFPVALRHALRLDADTLVVGETRDEETAELALRAALTGHRVLSTLHTEDAATAALRLLEMGLPPYLLAATLKGVVAQRLVRRICPNCREEVTLQREEAALLGLADGAGQRAFRGRGCDKCHGTGYRGRVALFEVLVVDEAFRAALLASSRPAVATLRQLAAKGGMESLRADAGAKVLAGETTPEEVARVLYG